jgi:hypothetical protein
MNIRTLIASTFILGAIGSSAFAAGNGSAYCASGSSYDRESLSCVSFTGAKTAVDNAGFAAQAADTAIKNSNVGDFVNETIEQRNERSDNR